MLELCGAPLAPRAVNDLPALHIYPVLKRNLIANYLGQGWTALMSLAFVPLYIKYLGIEAYGVIGLYAVLQTWLSLLDMGMTPALGREMARYMGGARSAQSVRDLLRSIEWMAGGIALLIALGVWAAANWLASDWLQAEKLPTTVVAQAFAIMGFVTALRFVEGIYRSSISGLQRQVLLNTVSAGMATLRGLGAVAILAWVSPTLEAYFYWQVAISLATIALLITSTYRLIPRAQRNGQFSLVMLRGIWQFAGGMLGITLLTLLMTQVDKVLLSKLLTLADYGYYTISAAVAGTIFMFIGPIAQAWYPRFCELHASGNQTALAENFHQSTQLVTVIAGSVAVIVIFFSQELLLLWTQNKELAEKTSVIVSVLMLGNLLNGFMTLPYQMQLAHGWTSLTIKINIAVVTLVVPLLFWVTPRWGAVGAAWVWTAINAFYIFVAVHFMYRRILINEKWVWYWHDIFLPLISAMLIAGFFDFYFASIMDLPASLTKVIMVSFLTIAAAAFSSSYVRPKIREFIMSIFRNCKHSQVS